MGWFCFEAGVIPAQAGISRGCLTQPLRAADGDSRFRGNDGWRREVHLFGDALHRLPGSGLSPG